MRRRRRRVRALLVGVVAAATMVVVATVVVGIGLGGSLPRFVGGGSAPGSSPRSSSAAVPPSGELVAALAAADELLDARAAAVRAGDRLGWARTIADPAGSDGERLRAQFDVLTELKVTGFEYEPARELPDQASSAEGGQLAVAVPVRYLIEGFDTAPARAIERLRLARTPAGWRIASVLDEPAGDAVPVWSLPKAEVLRSEHAVVAGDVPRTSLAAYAEMADTALAQVAAVWHRTWPERLVILLPGSRRSLQRLAGTAEDLSQVAGLTVGALGEDGRARADRVLLNPDALGGLTSAGRQFVLTHEASHVAVRASHPGRTPMWFAEGLADYIAYLPLRRDPREVSPELMDEVRAGRWPARLPVEGDFTAAHQGLAATYAASWFAVDELVRRHGQPHMLGLFSACTAPLGESGELPDESVADALCDRAFPGVLRTTEAEFTQQWYARMRQVAAGRS